MQAHPALFGVGGVIMTVRDSSSYGYVNTILSDMFNAICSVLPVSTYAFKGGYVLKSILDSHPSTKDLRRTTDLDMDVSSEEYFDMVIQALIPVAEKWISRGVVQSYKYAKPTEKMVGYFKLYRKPSQNIRAFVFCGVDIGLHPLYYGIVRLNNGINVYSIERMLSDKLWAMYTGTEKLIIHRAKDILDVYLICRYYSEQGRSLDTQGLVYGIRVHMQQSGIYKLGTSNLERLFINKPQTVYNALSSLINSVRVSDDFRSDLNINTILKTTIKFLNSVRDLL